MSTPKNNSTTAKGTTHTIEDALTILRQGKEFEKQQLFWKAAERFLEGRQVLETLKDSEQDRKIASLYHEKALEYLGLSRSTLIEALKAEVQPEGTDPVATLTEDQAALRNRIFCTLFSKPTGVSDTLEQRFTEQQLSIEERLEVLNASLPSGFKTDDERLDSINKGLNKLGLSLYTQKAPFASIQESLPKSEDEQIDEIMAQVTDEVAFEQQFGSGTTPNVPVASASNAQHDDDLNDDDDDDSFEDYDSPQDLKLNDEQLVIKHIKRRVVCAQQKLANLVALLDQAHRGKDDKNLEDTLSDDGEEYLRSGKKKLLQAQRHLQKALAEWNEELTG